MGSHSKPQAISKADVSAAALKRLRDAGNLFTRGAPELSETDTRVKLIDPIFKDVLGWAEVDIRREEPVEVGFVDYVFGADFPYFHVEAKRAVPRFSLVAPDKDRYLQLSGPHLLGKKEMKAPLEQAAKYAFDLGTDFAILTNGDQFIVFQTRIRGKSWRDGFAIVWHDYDDVLGDFAYFHKVLSADRVRAGSLNESFAAAAGVTTPLYTPIESIRNSDADLVRNKFWTKIARVVGPLLIDDPQATDVQDEIIKHCYVRTPLSDEVDASISRLLSDTPSKVLADADVEDLKPGMDGRTSFDHRIEEDIKGHRSGTYILTGGVGSGKTTFLRRFERHVGQPFIRRWCVWLHIDFLPLGDVPEAEIETELTRHTYERIRELLKQNYPQLWPADGERVRTLFARQIEEAKLTVLYGLSPDSPEWDKRVNEIVHPLFIDPRVLVEAILTHAATQTNERIVLVLDNTDQLGEKFQESVFLLSQKLARSCSALTIVALREEKFFAAFRRGIFDAYGDRRFHIGSPNLEDVVRKRLRYASQKYSSTARAEARTTAELNEVTQIDRVINAFIRSATKRNQNIIRLLACVSNGDMRHALGMFREFVSSGNTDIEKILRIVATDGGYSVPFHEFAKSAILGSRRYYRNNLSHVINLFVKSSVPSSSHAMALRLLARLASASTAPSTHGAEGFVQTTQLLLEARQSFGRADDFLSRGDELLARGLLESEPPRARQVTLADALRVSASGMYYFKYLVRSFAYLDLVFVDTAITDKDLAARLATLAQAPKGDMQARFDRVRLFLDYLEADEALELVVTRGNSGPYVDALVPAIRAQIETEINVISEKTGTPSHSPFPRRKRRRRRGKHQRPD
jgi:hypothetical protein